MTTLYTWFDTFKAAGFLWQFLMVCGSAVIAYGVARPFLLPFLKRTRGGKYVTSILGFLSPAIVYTVFMGCLLFCSAFSLWLFNNATLLFLALQLSLFLVVGRYVYLFSASRMLSICVGLFLCGIWALNKVTLLGPLRVYLNSHSFTIGTYKITPDGILKSILIILFLFWVTSLITSIGERTIKKSAQLDPGTKDIAIKIFDVLTYFFAVVIGLNVLGVNLTTLNVIGGALGVGIGFGLQKITSNFISGLILLFERSIKVGDMIELGPDAMGTVKHMGARCVLVEAPNGKDLLIPNEDLITHRVANWTLTDSIARIDISVTVSYDSDLKLVQKLMEESACENPAASLDQAPFCVLRKFADHGVEVLLVFYVKDVKLGLFRPQSEVMLSILEKFKAHGVVIPYPQTVVTLN